MTEEAVAENVGKRIWRWIDSTELLYVVGGGAVGGFLMPLVQRFLRAKEPFVSGVKLPEVWDAWLLAAVLGAICAGVVVYSLSYSDNNNRRQIFFISLLAGLTFPSFLSSTLDIDKTVAVQTAELSDAKNTAGTVSDSKATEEQKLEAVEESTDTAKEALTKAKAGSLETDDKIRVEGETRDVIDSLVKSADVDAANQDPDVTIKIAEKVAGVLKTADDQGYSVISADDVTERQALEELQARAQKLREQRNQRR